MKHDLNIPKEIVLETISCDLCGGGGSRQYLHSTDYYNNVPGEFTVVQCDTCTLRYTNPRPNRETIGHYYPDSSGYYEPSIPKKPSGLLKKTLDVYYGYGNAAWSEKLIFFPLYLLSYKKIQEKGFPKFIQGGSILDIGCSHGVFLAEMKSLGWKVYGVEMNHTAAQHARTEHGISITEGMVDDFNIDKKFDVVTLRMVAEHVHSPSDVLNKACELLKPGGTLILTIPDISGFEAQLHGKRAYTLQLPTHLTHYTPKTIKKYLEKTGFSNTKITHHTFDRDLIAPFSYKAAEGSVSAKIIAKILMNKIIRKTVVRVFVTSLSLFGKTSRMSVYATKNST